VDLQSRGRRIVQRAAVGGAPLDDLRRSDIRWDQAMSAHGPTRTALRTGKTVVARVSPTDPSSLDLRGTLSNARCAAAIAVPFGVTRACVGSLSICAAEPDAFDDDEIRLVEALAVALGQGVQTIRQRAVARQDAERVAHLTSVLAAARTINQLIVREHDQQRLLQVACEVLAAADAFEACCIATMNGGRLRHAVDAGDAACRAVLRGMLSASELPLGPQRPITADLPLYAQTGDTVSVRIEHKGHV
jgi:GAF domain